jgi:hypothetical protein
MRKIIANGQSLTPDGSFYLVLEQLEDGTIKELMNDKMIVNKDYPRMDDNVERTAIVNKIMTTNGEPELTQEEIDFMMSYRPGDIV